MPTSGVGKTITTVEPKFIPKNAAVISMKEDTKMKIRLVDCVGYPVEGAAGIFDEGKMRMVKTPWMEKEIPFAEAAEMGTKKVIDVYKRQDQDGQHEVSKNGSSPVATFSA